MVNFINSKDMFEGFEEKFSVPHFVDTQVNEFLNG